MDDASTLTPEELALYSRVASYYYKHELTQEEIGRRLRMSRQWVNRILAKCLKLGIVEIRIRDYESTFLEMESALENKFNLEAVRIAIESINQNDSYASLGELAAQLLVDILREDDVVGFSRGSTLASIVEYMPQLECKNACVTQLMGGWNSGLASINGDSIVLGFASKIGASVNLLYAPVVVSNKAARDSLRLEPHYQKSYEVMKSATIAVMGIADVNHAKFPPLLQFNFKMPPDAVGEICGRPFDSEGLPVMSEFDDRTNAIELDDLIKIPLRIGVAGMLNKKPAILGALRGGYINALVTDAAVAKALLENTV